MSKVQLNSGLSVGRVNMLDGLKKLSGAVNAKVKIPILQAVEIVATEKEIILKASDMDITVVVKLENESGFVGKFVVDYKTFLNFLKKSKAHTIELQYVNACKVSVKAEKITYNLLTHDKDDYPRTPEIKFDTITLTKDEFEKAMKNTLYALATSESRPVLTGVNVQYNNKGLKFVATDSHRLAQYELWDYYTTDNEYKAVPHGESLKKALKIIDKKCERVTIGFESHYTLLQFDNVQVYIRNLEGNYPDTSRLIPDSFKTEINLNVAEMLESLDMMKVLYIGEKWQTVRMDITEKSVELSANKPETDESMKADISYSEFIGESLKISFNGTYMMDALKLVENKEILAQFYGSMRPFILKPDSNTTHLILPIRTY